MPKRIRTTYTFDAEKTADSFIAWLKRYENDRNYGYPKHICKDSWGPVRWSVEYEYDANNPVARGVAIGIDWVPDEADASDIFLMWPPKPGERP